MLFVGPQPSTGRGYGLMRRTDPIRRDPLQLRFQPAKLVSAPRTTQSLCCAPSPDLSQRARRKPLPVLNSFRHVGLPTRALFSLVAVSTTNQLDPPTHCACGSSSVNESLKYLLTSLRLPSIVVILTRWWFLFVFVHHFGIVLWWPIVVAALLRKRAT